LRGSSVRGILAGNLFLLDASNKDEGSVLPGASTSAAAGWLAGRIAEGVAMKHVRTIGLLAIAAVLSLIVTKCSR
jgi:hypothetical protein